MATSKVVLKLLINRMERKVVFAGAEKDFVDFLFYIFSLPVGTVIQLLKNKTTIGWCLGDLYQSIEALNESYIQSNQNKNWVLNPKSPVCPTEIPLLLLPDSDGDQEPKARKLYACGCSRRHVYVTDDPHSSCPSCNGRMDSEKTFVSSQAARTSTATAMARPERGFVKELVTYMVMDNLEVMPSSPISTYTLLKKNNLDLGDLEDKVVDFGLDEGLNLLKASMQCKNVLTTVFLGNMGA